MKNLESEQCKTSARSLVYAPMQHSNDKKYTLLGTLFLIINLFCGPKVAELIGMAVIYPHHSVNKGKHKA